MKETRPSSSNLNSHPAPPYTVISSLLCLYLSLTPSFPYFISLHSLSTVPLFILVPSLLFPSQPSPLSHLSLPLPSLSLCILFTIVHLFNLIPSLLSPNPLYYLLQSLLALTWYPHYSHYLIIFTSTRHVHSLYYHTYYDTSKPHEACIGIIRMK